MVNGLATIAIDLTPVLPGGENGGAKVLALRLVPALAALAPRTRFIVLTQAASHAELAALDAPNVERRQVIGAAAAEARSSVFASAGKVLRAMPAPVRAWAGRLGYGLHQRLKRRGATASLHGLGVQLLFCPFTAPTFREAGIPTVCTVNDVQHRAYPQFFEPEDAMQRDRAFLDACRHATLLTAISDFSRQETIAFGGVDPSRVVTVAPRVAAVREAAVPEEMVRRHGLEPGRYFLYPANFWPHKNHELLLTAYGMAARAGLGDVKLLCTGAPGRRRDFLVRAAEHFGLAGRVIFPGFVAEGELDALLAGARALVFPSLFEGFGIPVVEAMARGVPVACSNVTALPEVAGDAALLFDPRSPGKLAEALVAIAHDAGLRERLAGAGRRRAALFVGVERMARDYWAVFEQCVARAA